jgi:hypothetical protein
LEARTINLYGARAYRERFLFVKYKGRAVVVQYRQNL